MIGLRTLLVNPPRIDGVGFTRQGRCQEREEVLGTTKPPYTLALVAAMLRERGSAVRLEDLTATDRSIAQLIEELDRESFRPTLIVFASTTPTLDADAAAIAKLSEHYGAPTFCFGPHASGAPYESMARAPSVDGMLVGEPEDGLLALAGLASLEELDSIPSLIFRRHGAIVPHRARGSFSGFLQATYPAWDLLDHSSYRLPIENAPYLMVETSRGCPHACDFCIAPIHQGHAFRERSAKAIVDDIERGHRELGVTFFYLWADTATLNTKTFAALCDELIVRNLPIRWFSNARADNLGCPEFVARMRRAGCWMLALGIETESEETRKNMMKRLEGRKIRAALANMRAAGIRSFAFFVLGYPGETPESLERTIAHAIELDPDYANFYPVVPYPGTELHARAKREGLLVDEDWSRMEYSYYLLRGNGLDERVVMAAVHRAKQRFYLRPAYLARHVEDIVRLVATRGRLAWLLGTRMLFAHRARVLKQPETRHSRAAPTSVVRESELRASERPAARASSTDAARSRQVSRF